MEEPSIAVVPVSIVPKNVYGLRSEVVGNIHFSYNQEVIYPVESVLVFHDFSTNKQRFLRLPEHTVPTFMTINSSRRLLAVVEYTTYSDGKTATNISIYDTCTLKKRRNFQLPEDSKNDKIAQLTFVQDSRALVILSVQQTLYMMFFDKIGTIAENQVGQANQRVRATCIACNPHDMGLVAVCGEGIIKMLSKTETGFSMNAVKVHFNVMCLAWLSMEMLLLGLKKNKMALIENGELKQTFRATEMDLIDLSKDPDLEEETPQAQEEQQETKSTSTEDVRCIVSLSKLLAYTLSDEVYVFEKTSKYKYQRLAIIKRHLGVYSEDLYKIDNLAINPQQDTVIATAKHSQIYVANLKDIQVGEATTHLRFSPLGVLLHIDEIVDISICSWKPIIMTASKDQTIRVWNYETESLELVKRYQVDISVTELNQTGQFAAVGFSDQLRIMQIFLNDLHIFKTYNFPRCSQVRYSFFGHMMAAAYDNFISITSVYTLDILKTLKGHNGDVLSLAWSRDDKYLISGGAEGAIYQWDVETGARIHEIVQKGTEYRALRCTGTDPLSIYAATGSGLLRELSKSELVRELSTVEKTPFLSLDLARSDLMLFLSTEAGHLYNVQLPFLDAGGGTFTNYRFFDSAVTKVVFSHDDTLLITASKRGTLAIWFLQNIEGKVSALDQDLLKGQEVLIPRHVLREKIEQISNLEIRLQQQAAEFAYQESQNEIFDSQQLADIHKGYCQALEALKNINSELEQKHIQELNEITFRINDLKAEHKRQIQNLSEQFTERMLMEYQKYTSFSQSSKEIKDTFEDKLRKSAGTLQDTVEALEVDYKKQLEQRQELIRGLMQEIQDEKFEFYEYCRQVAVENEANMADTVIKYENLIKREQDEEIVWRGKAGVLKKMADTMSKQVEHLLEDVVLLNEERVKSQKTIDRLRREIENLRKEISERESAINLKEKRIQEVLHRNQDLEKYKQLFSFKITELKMQIEPREYQINEKRKQITQLEEQLDALNKANVQMETQIKTLTEKHMQASDDLGKQRSLATRSREFIYTICTDIYNVSGKINDADELTTGVDELYKKYAKDDALKKHIQLESQVQAEFNRQRSHMEKSISDCKQKLNTKVDVDQSASLLKENIRLLSQIELLRKKNVNLTKDLSNMSAKLKLPARMSTAMQQKLGLTLEEIEVRRLRSQGKLQTLQGELDALMSQNQTLTMEMEELTDFGMPIEKSETIAQL